MQQFRSTKNNFNKAFSLLELIIYVAILSGLLVVASNIFISISKGSTNSQVKSEVNSAIRFSEEIMKQDLKGASFISVPAMGASGPTLVLIRNGVTITYTTSGGSLVRQEGSLAPVNITNSNIKVGTPTFTRIENTNSLFHTTNVAIKADIPFSYNSTSPEYSLSSSLKAVVSLTSDNASNFTGSYTFPTYTLNITKNGTGANAGIVTSLPSGINCGAICSAVFPQGANYNVTLTASNTATLTGWSGAGCSGTSTCVVSMSSNQTVNATFVFVAPTLTTNSVTNISQTTATGGGVIVTDGGASITAKGIVWDIGANPTIALPTKTNDGTGSASYSSNITGLSANTVYHVRAYATNSLGTSYGADTTFTTLSFPPTVTTNSTSSITQISAIGGGTISSNGGSTVTVSGIVWDISSNPTTALTTKTTDGWATGGPWTSSITGLTPNTFYHVRAYATNSAGTSYGSDVTFTTLAIVPPTVITTDPVTSVAQNAAIGGGTISYNGGSSVTISGIVWDTSLNPTVALVTKTTDGWATGGPWTSNLTGLAEGTLYHVRAYATNNAGTSYGSDVTFTTTLTTTIPTVTTPTADLLTTTTATLGANITSLGIPATVTQHGVCLGTSPNPSLNCVNDGAATIGIFTQARTGLASGTLYYYRGYAVNSTGTAYSNDATFTTVTIVVPTITTANPVTNITSSSATGGGTISSNGGGTVTTSGIVWDTSSNPTTALTTKTTDGWAIGGPWTSNITGLTPSTLYHVRAYATNSAGTSYGVDVTFSTIAATAVPTVTTPTSSSITTSTVTLGANVTSLGIPAAISSRGVCYGTSPSPTTNCTPDTSGSASVKTLIVAGGGGGGGAMGGGGGAGGVIYNAASSVSVQSYAVTIGTGGASGVGTSTLGINGVNSVFNSQTAIGGGGGSFYTGGANPGSSGGSGGGGAGYASGAGGSGTSGQGNAGGAGNSNYLAGGGGGASAVGQAGQASVAGYGGAGVTNSISGSAITYAGGGGGGGYSGITCTGGAGGTGGGGAGTCLSNSNGTAGTANTGGGGGGGGYSTGNGGLGGSGIVIISYPAAGGLTATGGTVTTVGSDKIHTFTSSGTFAVSALPSMTTGSFSQPITGLNPGTLYYYRGYAINSTGTAYSADGTFTTTAASAPTVTTTSPVTSILATSAVGGGTISSNGGATVSVSGLVWSTGANPTTANSKTTDGWAIGGPWTSSMTGLTAGTLYHVRAYATNIAGTSYGVDVTFTSGSACGGTSYNGYCWYKQTVQGQTCNTYCSGIGKSCVNSVQTCAQDQAVLPLVGVSCSSWSYDPGQSAVTPQFSGGTCYPRTSGWGSCQGGNITSGSCSSSRMYWAMVCSCSN